MLLEHVRNIIEDDEEMTAAFRAQFLLGHGKAFSNCASHTQAYGAFQRALSIQEGIFGPQHAELALTLTNLGAECLFVGPWGKNSRICQPQGEEF